MMRECIESAFQAPCNELLLRVSCNQTHDSLQVCRTQCSPSSYAAFPSISLVDPASSSFAAPLSFQERLDLLSLRAMENASAKHKANCQIDDMVKALAALKHGVVRPLFLPLAL
eukprot:1153215-Pelagomonas_calceolata.AAC.12